MSIARKYFWRDNKGKVQSSMGIELEDWEKGELARRNNQIIRKQLDDKKENKTGI